MNDISPSERGSLYLVLHGSLHQHHVQAFPSVLKVILHRTMVEDHSRVHMDELTEALRIIFTVRHHVGCRGIKRVVS